MTTLREAAQQALEALEKVGLRADARRGCDEAVGILRAALAQQDEPVEPVAWVASKDGRVIYDYVSTDDCLLRVSGDFENDEQRFHYAKQIVDKLNAAPPRRTMVPLTEEEIKTAFHAARNAKLGASQDNSRHRLSVIEIARAVEKTSWEKNHGKA